MQLLQAGSGATRLFILFPPSLQTAILVVLLDSLWIPCVLGLPAGPLRVMCHLPLFLWRNEWPHRRAKSRSCARKAPAGEDPSNPTYSLLRALLDMGPAQGSRIFPVSMAISTPKPTCLLPSPPVHAVLPAGTTQMINTDYISHNNTPNHEKRLLSFEIIVSVLSTPITLNPGSYSTQLPFFVSNSLPQNFFIIF